MNRINLFFAVLLLLLTSQVVLAQTEPMQHNNKATTHWFDQKEWLNGLRMEPHASVNKEAFAQQYAKHKDYWDKAFLFLKEHHLDSLPVGKYIIDGDNVFATITNNNTKDKDSTKWESHQQYIDLQSVISGEEIIGVAPANSLAVTMPFDAAKDLVNYSGEGTFYNAKPGVFFLFFPADAHRPNITTGGHLPDKKVVVKIRVAE